MTHRVIVPFRRRPESSPIDRESFTAEAQLVPVQGEQKGQSCTVAKALTAAIVYY